MSSIAQVSEAMQTILTSRAKALERQTGGCRNVPALNWTALSLPKPAC